MCLEFLLKNDFENFTLWIKESRDTYITHYTNTQQNKNNSSKQNQKKRAANFDDFINFRHVKEYDPDNFDTVDDEQTEDNKEENKKIEEKQNSKKFIEVLTGSSDPIHVEAVVEIFTFDIVIEFFIKNSTKYDYQNVTIDLYAPNNLDIIEKAHQVNLAANESKTVRSCIKFFATCNSYIFGQITYANNKGALNSINLSGIFIDLMVLF